MAWIKKALIGVAGLLGVAGLGLGLGAFVYSKVSAYWLSDQDIAATFGQFDDVEMQALFSYLQSLPATPFGNR